MRDFWHRRGQREQIIPHQGETSSDGFREHPVWLGVTSLLLPAGRGSLRIADMGSGTGIVAEHLARLGHTVITIEFAESRTALARRRLAPYPTAKVRLGDATDPPLRFAEVDAIVSRNLLWLLRDPAAALLCWRKLVAPGGRIAAIDASCWARRHWGLVAQRALRPGPAPRPLADIADAGEALRLWQQAGLREARTLDLSWASEVKLHHQPAVAKFLNRSVYYAVLGEAG